MLPVVERMAGRDVDVHVECEHKFKPLSIHYGTCYQR